MKIRYRVFDQFTEAAAFAATVILLAAGAPPEQLLRAEIVRGTPQSAHAYAAPSAKRYYAVFPEALVVRWVGPAPGEKQRKVQFTCEGCIFLATDQPDKGENVERINGRDDAYTAKVFHGEAAVRVDVAGQTLGTYVVRAEPVARAHERSEPSEFKLTLR